jgi:CBS domain-containing protein/anti-sigma regulatory factor (Ser/Thr protein kinase)
MDNNVSSKGRVITDKEVESITRVEELAYELKIEEVMCRELKTVRSDISMGVALDLFRQMRISGAPVVDNGNLVGILSLEDLIRCLRRTDLDSRVNQYMTRDVITIHSGDPVIEALKVFVSVRLGRLPVVNDAGELVGILTKGDINRGLLNALQKDYQVEEIRRYRASHLFEDIVSDRTSLILRYPIRQGDFTNGGSASSYIKRALLRLGASPLIARRCGIAIYEAEMNLIIHTTNGGVIRVEIEPHQISIDASDEGPGIKDINLAMKAGYSTASEEVREQGFGAGMGLANIARCVDDMKLESIVGKGTRLKMRIYLHDHDAFGEQYPHV